MLGADSLISSDSAAKYLFEWMLSKADVWYLLYRCVEYISKAHEPVQNSAALIDRIFVMDDIKPSSSESNNTEENRQEPEVAWWRS